MADKVSGENRGTPALTVDDDGIHQVDAQNLLWRENWYFEFFDHQTGVYGIASVGVRPNIRRSETVFAVFEGQRALHMVQRPDIDIPPDIGAERQHYGPVAVECVKPFKEWRIRFDEGDCQANLTWKALCPPYDYDWFDFENSRHYQHPGLVEGSITIKDRTIPFQGFGERDHAWGSRDYGVWEQCHWLNGQFNRDFCFHASNLTVKGKDYLFGYVFKDGKTFRLSALITDAIYAYPGGPPVSYLLRMQDEEGRFFEIRGELINVIHAMAARAGSEWHYFACFCRFTCGDLIGYGRADHIWSDREAIRSHLPYRGENWGTLYHDL